MNWRKPVFKSILHLNGYSVGEYMKYIESVQFMAEEELQRKQNELLSKLLLHAYEKVPYYSDILPKAGVVENGTVNLTNFGNIPILTKDIIRREGERLYSSDMGDRRSYKNSSGGSTGEPVVLMQDIDYQGWGLACRFVFNRWAGKDIGERELKLWGSERDILQGGENFTTRLKRWLFNVDMLSTYRMSKEDMSNHIKRWNMVRPVMVWAYTDSMYKLSQFVESENLSVYSPKGIICTTSAMLPEIRSHVEKTFGCKVYDQYGSREVGPIAAECSEQKGLHIFSTNQKIEVLGANQQPIEDEGIGEIVVTNLHNYSMPLIRYSIGDTARLSNEKCSCGRGFTMLKEISGRKFAHFVRKDGAVIHSQFFVGLMFFRKWIREFKVIQKKYDLIEILVAKECEPDKDGIEEITGKIKQVMGGDCVVDFVFVDEVPATESGKYIYTHSEVEEQND